MTTSMSRLNKTPFVGRTYELSKLQYFLDLAKRGAFQVCFIAGEAGSGKTALLEGFQLESKRFPGEIIFVTGECNAQTGQIDPYLPFKTIIQSFINWINITENNQDRGRKFARLAAQTILELAPDLIGNFFPGGMLLAKGLNVLIEKTGIREQILVDKSSKRLFELKAKSAQST